MQPSAAGAVVVLGYHPEPGEDVSPLAVGAVRAAERLAAGTRPEVVVLTGGAKGAGPSEAEQMARLWRVPGVELELEPYAADTVQNAVLSLEIVLRRGCRHATVVCAVCHALRVWLLFRPLYRRHGVSVRVAPFARPLPSARRWLFELRGLAYLPRMLRSARAARVTPPG